MAEVSENDSCRWETEASSSYKRFLPEKMVWKTDLNKSPISSKILPVAPPPSLRDKNSKDDSEEWILVDKNQLKEDGSAFATLKTKQNDRKKKKKKRKVITEEVSGTRELGDTAYHNKFRKPIMHDFGRANTKPVNERDYLRTFNVKAAENNPVQVKESALSFQLQRHKKMKATATTAQLQVNKEQQNEDESTDSYSISNEDKATESAATVPVLDEITTTTSIVHEKAYNPSMYTALSWRDENNHGNGNVVSCCSGKSEKRKGTKTGYGVTIPAGFATKKSSDIKTIMFPN